jgi:ribosome-binding factor A
MTTEKKLAHELMLDILEISVKKLRNPRCSFWGSVTYTGDINRMLNFFESMILEDDHASEIAKKLEQLSSYNVFDDGQQDRIVKLMAELRLSR